MSEIKFINWADEPQADIAPGVRRRHLSGDNVMLVEVAFEDGAVVPEHSHPHEQMTNLISGRIELVIGDQKQVMVPDKAALIPANVPHSAVALEPSVSLDIFSPPREDFLAG